MVAGSSSDSSRWDESRCRRSCIARHSRDSVGYVTVRANQQTTGQFFRRRCCKSSHSYELAHASRADGSQRPKPAPRLVSTGCTGRRSKRAAEVLDDAQKSRLCHLGPDLLGQVVGQSDGVEAAAGAGLEHDSCRRYLRRSRPHRRARGSNGARPAGAGVDDSSTRTSGKAIKIAPSARKTGGPPRAGSAHRAASAGSPRVSPGSNPRGGAATP